MDHSEIIAVVADSLSEVLERELPDLSEDMRLFEELSMDSTSVLELLMTLEDNLGIEIDAEDLDMADFKTIGTLAAYLERLVTESTVVR
jgi:acyl carrier protein